MDSGFHASLPKEPEIETHKPGKPRTGSTALTGAIPTSATPTDTAQNSTPSTATATAAPSGSSTVSTTNPPTVATSTGSNGSGRTMSPTAEPSGTNGAAHSGGASTTAEPSGTTNGLPQRRRRRAPLPQRRPQENLAPQLREDPDAEHSDIDRFAGRTRSTLSAFRKGTLRGRDADGSAQPTDE